MDIYIYIYLFIYIYTATAYIIIYLHIDFHVTVLDIPNAPSKNLGIDGGPCGNFPDRSIFADQGVELGLPAT